jgi:peroxiredoxin
VLSSLEGEKILKIDTFKTTSPGFFQFDLEAYHTGFYRLAFINNKWIDFIYDNEDIEIATDADKIFDSLKVITSASNKLYYEFIRLNKDYKTKSELLQFVLSRYPEQDDYYKTTMDKLISLQEDYLYFVNVTSQENPNSFIARYVRSAQLPVTDTAIQFDQQLNYLKTNALNNINFYDETLIYSDAFTNKTIEYLTYFRNPQFPLELLEKEFMAAIDSILSKANVNKIVYKHIVEYLLDGFRKFGFDNVINYIVENYVIKDDICLDEKLETALERRIQHARNFKVGRIVPDILLPDSSGSIVDLNELNAEKILVVFYASWCSHCKTLLPRIFDLYKNQSKKEFEVIAVSIDTSRTDWINFIKGNNLNWNNVADLKGWEGQSVIDYYIYATPTMFLIDKNKRLIALLKSFEELKSILEI